MIILETDRLYLRTLTLDDVDNLLGIYSDPVVMKHYPATRDRAETEAYIQRILDRYENDGYGFWGCIRRDDDTYLGNCGCLNQEVDGETFVEVGYHFLRAHWGNGYASEAANACRDYAFEKLGVELVISLITPANEPSLKVAKRNGMTLDRMTWMWEMDIGVHQITRAEWSTLKQRA